jgi:TolA-binding protein
MSNKVSPEVQAEAERIANGTKRPGQTKDQIKAIRQGIEKGIVEYKKQQKAKARERDKQNKKEQQEQEAKRQAEADAAADDPVAVRTGNNWLPWTLLAASWAGFGVFQWFTGGLG